MIIPLVNLTRQNISERIQIQKKIRKISEEGDFILGKEVTKFEKAFASYIGTDFCIGVASGTDALLLTLKALGISKGDEVIVPAFTFIATVTPLIMLGITPVFTDILSENPLIDPEKIEFLITKKTKAIIPVHLYGQCCQMEKLLEICKKYNLHLIEDACQSHGSTYNYKKSGSFGICGIFSFYPAKNLGAYGDAGAIVTSDKKIADKLFALRDHGQKRKYYSSTIGYNSRLDNIQAAVLRIKLKNLDNNNSKRHKIAVLYKKCLKGLPIKIVQHDISVYPNYHLFVIITDKRDKLASYLSKKGIQTGIHYPVPVHLQKALKFLGFKKGSFPNAEKLADTCLSLPIFPKMSKNEVFYVALKIKEFFAK